MRQIIFTIAKLFKYHLRYQSREYSTLNLRGILATDAASPSDETLKEDYINYLEEKYG